MQNRTAARNPPRPPSCCCDWLEPRVLLAATLVKDINLVTPPSYPGWFTDLNGTLLFVADDGVHGADWWRSDGTAAGTRMVKDLDLFNPFGRTQPPMRRLTAVIGDAMLFAGPQSGTAFSLYRTDGTEAGTAPVVANLPGGPSFFATLGGEAFFASGGQVWKSDGTAAGTARVTSFASNASARPLVAVGDKVLFQANGPGGTGMELWATDGTEAGTFLVKDINPGAASSEPGFSLMERPTDDGLDRFIVSGGRMYFSATTAANGRELWVTDGTPEGTHLVIDVVPGTGSAWPWKMAEHRGEVYFTASAYSGSDPALRLYRVAPDGGGATLVGSVPGGFPLALEGGGQRLLLLAFGPAYPTPTLYTLDDAGTALVEVRTFQSPTGMWRAQSFARHGDYAYFYLNGDTAGAPPGVSEVWRTDGTAAGTTRVASFNGILHSADPIDVFTSGGHVFFPGGTTLTQTELWRTDGTAGGTLSLGDLNAATTRSSSPTAPMPVAGGRWVFAANDGVNGQNLWVTDGTDAGTRRIGYDVVVQTESLVEGITRAALGLAWKGRAYFGVRVGSRYSLYSSDGTSAGTSEVFALPSGASPPRDLFVLGDRLLFSAYGNSPGSRTIWSTDGTTAGTSQVWHFNTPSNPQSLGFATLGGAAYFTAPWTPEGDGDELWKTDGTPAGTSMVRDINPGSAGSGPGGFVRVGDHLYFAAGQSHIGRELWRTDGTEAGTVLVKDVYPGHDAMFGHAHPSSPVNLRSVNGWLLFEARDAESPAVNRLYRSDGTAEGTVPLTAPDFAPKQIGALNLIGDGLVAYFFRKPSDGKPELWRTDGQFETTRRVKVFDTAGLPPTATPVGMEGAIVYVRITESTLNYPGSAGPSELWSSDGTLTGTRRVFSGPFQAMPDNAVVYDGRLFFTADDGIHGNELWTELLGAHIVGRHLFYNGSAFDGRSLSANEADDGAIAADKVALLPGAGAGSFANISSYSRGINGIMIDVSGDLPMTALAGIGGSVGLRVGTGGGPDTWADAPAHSRLTIRKGAGVDGSDRITLIWPDGAIRNTWLRITVNAPPMSGLARPDVFYFGNLVGETGDADSPLAVGGMDMLATRRALARGAAGIESRHDFNRDGRVNVFDYALARASQGRSLTPVANSGAAVAPAAADPRRRTASVRSRYAPATDAVREAAGDLP